LDFFTSEVVFGLSTLLWGIGVCAETQVTESQSQVMMNAKVFIASKD
jgi:hypothetical protein